MAGNWYDDPFNGGDDHHDPYHDAFGQPPIVDNSDDEEEIHFDDEGEEDEDESEEDDDEEEEGENGDEEEVVEVVIPPPPPPNPALGFTSRVSGVEERDKDLKPILLDFEGTSSMADDGEGSQKGWNREDVEGLFCPICMEPWSNGGDHQPSCLGCGHLFGMSCIKKWLGQRRNSGKCPQCNKRSTLKDVRRIYGSQVVVVDEESRKRIRFLEAKCESLEKKDKEWCRKEVEWHMKVLVWQKREAELCQQLQQLSERTSNLERTLGDLESKSLSSSAVADGFEGRSARGNKFGISSNPVSSHTFALQQELLLDGARCFDVDDSGQLLVIARRPARIGGSHILTKMSLFSPREQDNMLLPSSIKAVRDLHVSPFGRLALLASMGKKLSVVSMESNNIVLNYDLPAAAWSCSWDINSSRYAHAGLQNGMLLVFDLRQTVRPLEMSNGLTCNPLHTIYPLLDDSAVHSGVKKVLTASSVGLCQWDIGGEQKQPALISEASNQGVCISLAYCHSSDNIVATFRPKVEIPDEIGISQLSQTPSSTTIGHHVQGSHVLVKREGSSYHKLGSVNAHVPGIRLPKSTILGMGDDQSVFACGDEATSNLVLQELPSFTVTQCLPSHHPIRDLKYTASQKPGLLCCLGEDRVQFFSRKFL